MKTIVLVTNSDVIASGQVFVNHLCTYVHLEEPFCTFPTTTVSNQVMWTRYCNIFVITIFFFLCFKDVECVFVETTYGWIQGNVTQHAIVFLGVPFAQPPKRWEEFCDRKKISIRITSKVKMKSLKKRNPSVFRIT